MKEDVEKEGASQRLAAKPEKSGRNVRYTVRYTAAEDTELRQAAEAKQIGVIRYIRARSLGKRVDSARTGESEEQRQANRLVLWIAQKLEELVWQAQGCLDEAESIKLHAQVLKINFCLDEFVCGRVRFHPRSQTNGKASE